LSGSKLLGGILLVAGTAIGAGMLALPVVTGLAGFIPALLLFFFFWLFMTYTALLMLEVNLWMEKESNLITMAHYTLGKWAEIASWGLYLFLLYALTTAYLAGCAPIIGELVRVLVGVSPPLWVSGLPILLLFGYFVWRGVDSVDHLNRLMMIGLVLSFLFIVLLLTPLVDPQRFEHLNWGAFPLTIAFGATSFGYHIIIPTLTTYFERDVQMMRKAILVGSLIPLIVYLIWEAIALGIIPLNLLVKGFDEGVDGASLLANVLHNPLLSLLTRLFSFFAIVTSFLGVSLSLTDFLADGLHIHKSARGKFILCLLTFIPPLIFILTDPRVFLNALDYAGAFGVMFLLALLPGLMVWVGRYHEGYKGFRAPGGKVTLALSILFSVSILLWEIMSKFGF